MTRYTVRRKRPFVKAGLLAFVALVLWTGGQPWAVAVEAALVVAWMTRGCWAHRSKAVQPTEVQSERETLLAELAEAQAAGARYRALAAAVIAQSGGTVEIDAAGAQAADGADVVVAPTADGKLSASVGYPVRH
jgi:hypothetical protein